MPGRWAAPPAAAMMTRIPRLSAEPAYSDIHCGVRCAETILHSWETPNCVSVPSAWRMVSQSELLPMMTPTSAGPASDGDDNLLALTQRVARLAVEVAESFHLDDVEA